MVDHSICHPNGSVAHQAWAAEQTLHVAAMYSNPCRFRTRLRLFNDFRRHMESMPNIVLHVGELAYGDRPFEVTSACHPTDYQFRTRHELWHKENVLNLVIARFPAGWQYGAYCDGDFNFTRHDLGLETIHTLQHYDWVQMFSQYSDLGPDHQLLRTGPGFAYAYQHGIDVNGKALDTRYGWPGAPGGAWAFRREAFDRCGSLLDTCVLGSADHHMALGFVGWKKPHPDTHKCGTAYGRSIEVWQGRAFKVVDGNIGYVQGYATHHYHGPRRNRGYDWRWRILRDNDYNPATDVFRDGQGVWQLTHDKPRLRDEIRAYFRSRSEDDIRLN